LGSSANVSLVNMENGYYNICVGVKLNDCQMFSALHDVTNAFVSSGSAVM